MKSDSNTSIKVNENFVAFRMRRADWVPIEQPLNLDDEVELKVTGQVANIEYETNNDGTANRIFIIKGLLAEKV